MVQLSKGTRVYSWAKGHAFTAEPQRVMGQVWYSWAKEHMFTAGKIDTCLQQGHKGQRDTCLQLSHMVHVDKGTRVVQLGKGTRVYS